MKVMQVGNDDGLLWPNNMDAIAALFGNTTATVSLAAPDPSNPDLLWPAELINQQARARRQKDFSLPAAIIIFILAAVLGLVAGPLELLSVAANGHYSQAVHNSLFGTILPLSGIVSFLSLALIIYLFIRPNIRKHTIISLVASSLIILGLIWLFGHSAPLLPHQFTLLLLIILALAILLILFINKQYVATPKLSSSAKLILIILGIVAFTETIFAFTFGLNAYHVQNDPEIAEITAAQQTAKLEGASDDLSNLVFTVCDGSYQIIHLSSSSSAGLFECAESGDVYSVVDADLEKPNPTFGLATYFGTTKDKTITKAFPQAYYLYRSLPQVLSEDELVIMYPTNSEQELIDNLTPLLLSYWQKHSDRNLFFSAFYNQDINQITKTSDYVLMSVLGTMVMAESLPRGLTISGVHDGKVVDYQFRADTKLDALRELGADPDLYAASTREALTNQRHISLHLAANEDLSYDTLVAKLWESFTGGIE